MSEVTKHLIGSHDQQDHDPTKKKGQHERDEHMPWYREELISTGTNSARLMQSMREAWADAEDSGVKGMARQKLLDQALKGERQNIANDREKKRELSKEEKNAVQYHLTENTGNVALGGAAALAMGLFLRNPNMAREMLRFGQARSTRQINPNLSKTWKNAFSSGDAIRRNQGFERHARQMFEGTWGGYTSTVTQVTNPRPGLITVSGIVRKSGSTRGAEAGIFTRSFRQGGDVHHDLLVMDRAHQGTGFARGFYEHTTNAFRRDGFSQVTLMANIDIGGYAWARAGFDFAPGQAALSRAAIAARSGSIRRSNPGRYTRQEAMQARLMGLRPGTTPRDFSQIGRNRSWFDDNGIEHWFGKDLLLGTVWNGVRKL
jgi:GNAT superfamily N-acetyltransferase